MYSFRASGEVQKYTISTTWDSDRLDVGDWINFTFSNATDGMRIEFNAPLYNDPLPNAPPGRFDGLWNYEVVEVFFLGRDEKYLELEFGPGGHYLVYYLEGVRNVTKTDLLLEGYEVSRDEDLKTWKRSVVIPCEYFPPSVYAFNAYAIRGVEPDRVYKALFPVRKNEYPRPDFHRLSAFQTIDVAGLIGGNRSD